MGNIVGGIMGGGSASNIAPERAQIIAATNQEQADEQYKNVQDSLAQQQAFAQALQGQNGIQNQSNVYNQLQQQAAGQGPNPAQALLANQTGQNAAQQAALMAGQRGSSANSGLIARQAAQQGGNLQQQAAGQGAALQAQQSANAIGQMGQMAGQQVGQQAGATNAYNQAALQAQQNILGGIQGQNQANVAATGNVNQFNAQQAAIKAGQQGNMIGQMTGAIGQGISEFGGPLLEGLGGMGSTAAEGVGGAAGGLGSWGAAEMLPAVGGLAEVGGTVMLAADGGQVPNKQPMSHIGQHFVKMAQGGRVPALVSPGEVYLSPNDVQQVKQGAKPMQVGEKIPGKAKVEGAKNSYSNDTVPKTLETGGIVLPRSVTKSKAPDEAADKFVKAILARKGKGLK